MLLKNRSEGTWPSRHRDPAWNKIIVGQTNRENSLERENAENRIRGTSRLPLFRRMVEKKRKFKLHEREFETELI